MKCLAAALLPLFLGAAAPPPSNAGETIRVSRISVPCAGFCTIYDLTVTPDGLVWGIVLRAKRLSRDEVPIERISFVVTPAEAARFRAILRPYRPTRIRPAHDNCVSLSRARHALPTNIYLNQIAVKIDWLDAGQPQSVFTCDYDPDGFVPIVDHALDALHLDPNGHRIETGH